MIFGNSSDFAIESYHEPSGPKWGGFGRFCIYVGGTQIGNIRDNHCSLFHATDQMRQSANMLESLWDDSFAGLSDVEIFALLERGIYIGGPSGRDYWRFDFLTNTGEMFNGVKTFIICDPSGSVHILYRFRDDTQGSGQCSAQTFRDVVGVYGSWFDEQVLATAPPFYPINPFDLNEKVPDV
jgi:hypothetical protein